MIERVVVVGAGIAGLAAAAVLSKTADVLVVERLPAPGGTWEFDHPVVRQLVDQCRTRGARVNCGDAALRWVDRRLLVVGPGRREWIESDHLVFAGGARPATPAEIPVHGSRPAGLFVATVAHHLLQARVCLGRRIALCGTGFWADLVAATLPSGTHVTLVGNASPPRLPDGVSSDELPYHVPAAVTGHDRVESLLVCFAGERRALPCDAVILAGDLRPLRNVDGAVVDGPDVTFIQPTAPRLTAQAAGDFARRAAAALIAKDVR